MRLVASSSTDGTIKIWNEQNILVKSIKLNAVPHGLCFASERGDILVALGTHVHHIPHTAYLPRQYRLRMVAMQFPEQVLIEKTLDSWNEFIA